ncbi:MAG TPA: hypothetical protein VJ843_03755 [Candidatus Saccharimonadales bacterium]|nr:hypothetical protein [Candidatus Saccharimonadales bacterium]
MHFGCYSLHAVRNHPDLLLTIGESENGGVLTEIIQSFGLAVPDQLTSQFLSEVTSKVAPHKTLQDNIVHALKYLGEDAFQVGADWLQRSGAMAALRGSFCDPTVAVPQQVDTLVFSGGVANWMLRRLALAQRIDPNSVGQVLLPMGNRVMSVAEHQLVRTFANESGRLPTEAAFVDRFIEPALAAAGFARTQLIPVESGHAADVLEQLFDEHRELLDADHYTLVIGNAPNTIQAAGQFRLAARDLDKSYDHNGSQLFMFGDTIQVGVEGQPIWQAQNPLSGIGQILRSLKVLLENAELAA